MGLPRLRPLPSILLAVTVLAELGAVGLSWGLEPAWETLLWALSDTKRSGDDWVCQGLPRHGRFGSELNAMV